MKDNFFTDLESLVASYRQDKAEETLQKMAMMQPTIKQMQTSEHPRWRSAGNSAHEILKTQKNSKP